MISALLDGYLWEQINGGAFVATVAEAINVEEYELCLFRAFGLKK